MIDIYKELGEYGIVPVVVDPAADAEEAERLYGISFQPMESVHDMDAVIIAVAHDAFLKLGRKEIDAFYCSAHKRKVLLDIKGLLERKEYLTEDYLYWRL